MLNKKLSCIVFVMFGVFSVNTEAKVNCWDDANGNRQCGDTIPPEFANKNITKYSDKGRVEKRIVILTPEEQRAKDAADAKKNAAQQIAIEAKRRDTALLSTFSNEQEIDLARDRGLQQVEARINSVTTMLKSAQVSLAGLQQEQDGLLKQNKKIPKSLLDDIEAGEARVAKLQKELTQNEQESSNVKARFEADRLRYRELKGVGVKK